MRLSAKLNQKLRQRYKTGAASHLSQDKAQAFVGIDTVRLLPHIWETLSRLAGVTEVVFHA
jgi:hypothetical protein